MTTNLFKHIVVVTIIGLVFLAVNCSDKPDTGNHVHADGTVHADDEVTSDAETDDQGRSYHLHGDGNIHYLEPSESRVSGSTINMPPEEITKYDIGVATAGPGQLAIKTILPGEIAVNTNKMAHIVPRVPGMVREVKVKLGDLVRKGAILAVIDSRDLADARAAYLASLERLELAQAMFDLKEKLWKKNISPEKEYLNTKKDLAQAKIDLRTAKQKLISMGFTSTYLDTLPDEREELFTRYEVVAPLAGTVIEKNIAIGEILKDDAEVFVVADLKTVWINLQVYKKDLPLIRKGQHVRLVGQPHLPAVSGEIDYVGSLVGAQTQTALARVVISNPSGELRPGLYVKASITVKSLRADVLIRSEHVQYLNDNPCVFIRVSAGFELRVVTLGDTDGEYVFITGGLKAGEKYATKNSFLLKSEMDESASNMHVHSDGTVHIEQ
ncbi:efflux RND transporter periplasmic adaptor subunit [Acidobacteriota bacterium]